MGYVIGYQISENLESPKEKRSQILVPLQNLATPLAKNCHLAKQVSLFPTLHC